MKEEYIEEGKDDNPLRNPLNSSGQPCLTKQVHVGVPPSVLVARGRTYIELESEISEFYHGASLWRTEVMEA